MESKKTWHNYLWIVSALYLVLGFFNILFAWLGLICFMVPLLIAIWMEVKPTVINIVAEDNSLNCSVEN